MISAYETQYASLQSLLSKLKLVLDSANDGITNLLSASSTDKITKLSADIAQEIDNAHTIMHDYSVITCSISTLIENIEDDDQRELEKKKYDDTMDSRDGNTQLEFSTVSISSAISKMESRYSRVLSTATMRVNALSRLNPNPSTTSNPTPSIHSNHDSSAPSHPPMSTIDTSIIETLTQRIRTLETTHTPTHSPNLSLPPITLETFDGTDISKWSAYKYQLDMLILNQAHLNEVEKAYYVRSSLRGAALNLVVTIPTQKNFLSKIIERLELEYDRSSLTQATLLSSLLAIRSTSSKLEDQIEAARSMINLVHAIDPGCGLDGLLTQQQIADRIHPRFISLVWKRKPATLLNALQFIEESLRSELEEITITSAISEQPYPYQHNVVTHLNNAGVKSNRPTAADNHFTSPKVPKGPTCVFCGKHTYSGECTSVTSLKERMDILRTRTLCFCCFSSKHPTTACTKQCSICAGRHHRSICEKSSPISINSHTVSNHQSDRLFTVETQIANPDPTADNTITASIHLDHGAQANLITRDLANRLSLVPFDQREMIIAGFNSGSAHSSTYDIVKLDVVRDCGHYPIEAVVIDKSPLNSIHTQPLPTADLNVIHSALGYIPNQLTKHTTIHSELLLSVGDTLQLLDNSKVSKLPSGYRLVRSSIGPLVVGRNRTRIKPNDPLNSNAIHSLSNEGHTSVYRTHTLESLPITISTVTVYPYPHTKVENKRSNTNHPINHFHSPFAGPSEDSNVITHCNSNFNHIIPDSSSHLQPHAPAQEHHHASISATTPHKSSRDIPKMSRAIANVLPSHIDLTPIPNDSASTQSIPFIVKAHTANISPHRPSSDPLIQNTVPSLVKHPTIPPFRSTHCDHSHTRSSHSIYQSIDFAIYPSAHHSQLSLPHTSDPPLNHYIDGPSKMKRDSDNFLHHCYLPP